MTLRIEKISKRIADRWVLRDVSFTVEKGGIFGILGTNRSGKTTLLRLIAGLEKSNGGKILLDENAFSDPKQKFSFFSGSNQTNGFAGLFSRSRSGETKSDIQLSELNEKIENAEDILILDEPFVCLDRFNKENLAEKLKQTAKEKNLRVVFSTSDYRDIFSLCDQAGILHKSEIVQTGTPQEIYQNPESVAVVALFGENNLIPARRLTSNTTDVPEFFTIDGEHNLSTAKIDKTKLGTINQTITLTIRPEHISISFGASFPEDNLIKAKIEQIQFQGSTTLIQLNANGLKLKALVLRLVGLNIGDECMVGLPPDRILVLKN